MKRQLVFVPVAQQELGVLVGEQQFSDRVAYAVTSELLEELGYDPSESEDAEYAALVLASVAGLTIHGQRLVVVADVPVEEVLPGVDSANGEVQLAHLPTTAITAWFSEEPGVDVADTAAIVRGLTIDQAWEQPQVQQLLHDHDLLWNDVVEYRPTEGG